MNILMTTLTSALFNTSADVDTKANVHSYKVKDINLNDVELSDYDGKVLMIVNVASKCGFTGQYKELQEIYEEYKDRGFEVLGFPCNDFGGQEPGTNEEIKEFCSLNYNVTFPMFDKVKVKEKEKHPMFEMLTDNSVTGRSSIKWNFEKFIIDRKGNVVERFRTTTKPDSKKIVSVIEKELDK